MPSNEAATQFQCPKCGASSALSLPDPDPIEKKEVTLRCLVCAHVMRVPRDQVAAAGARAPWTDEQ